MTATAGPRSCRPCGGGGEGESWGTPCQWCNGTGEAALDAPPRLRISPSNAELDRLARLIDTLPAFHPEVQSAAAVIGRTDFTVEQCRTYIAALSALNRRKKKRKAPPRPESPEFIAQREQDKADFLALIANWPNRHQRRRLQHPTSQATVVAPTT